MDDPRKRELDALLKRRDDLRDAVQRATGRLDAARKELTAVETECHSRRVPPEKLDETIQKLEERFDTAVADLTEKIGAAETAVAPYMEEA